MKKTYHSRQLEGILCVDKPQDWTSFDVVAKMRGIADCHKIGHGGTLDPMATGVLPLFFGRSAKAMELMPVQDKRYTASIRMGVTTDTQACTGKILSTSEKPVVVISVTDSKTASVRVEKERGAPFCRTSAARISTLAPAISAR